MTIDVGTNMEKNVLMIWICTLVLWTKDSMIVVLVRMVWKTP